MNHNERTRFLIENPLFVKRIGLESGIHPQDSDDFTQSAILQSILAPCEYDSKRASIRTFSKYFIRLQARSWLKRDKKKPTVSFNKDLPITEPVCMTTEQIWDSFLHRIQSNGHTLSERQNEVLSGIRNGQKKAQIARELGISKQAVGKYAKQIRQKIEGNFKNI